MKIGVSIIYHPKLDKYLDMVIKNFRMWEVVCISQHSFRAESEATARNKSLKALKGCNYVFIVDSDEIILPRDQETLVKRMIDKQRDVGFCSVINYAKDFKHIYKQTAHKPAVIVRPDRVSFYDDRCLRFEEGLFCDDIYIHHFGFMFDDAIMEWKKTNYPTEKNQREIDEIMNREVEPFEPPKELMELLNGFHT